MWGHLHRPRVGGLDSVLALSFPNSDPDHVSNLSGKMKTPAVLSVLIQVAVLRDSIDHSLQLLKALEMC